LAKNDWSDVDLSPTTKGKIRQLQLIDEQLEAKKKGGKEYESQEDFFALQCRMRKLPPFARQYPFAAAIKRRWTFDFAWLLPRSAVTPRTIMLAVEIEGVTMMKKDGHWQMGGRHASITGFKEDCIKYNTAIMLGWYVLRFERDQVKQGYAIAMTQRVLHRMGWRIRDE